jgi:hypothetical protein
MAKRRGKLQWVVWQSTMEARCGRMRIGYVVRRDDGTWVYEVTAVHTKWLAKGYGEVASLKTAKAAVSRVWRKWLERAELV